MNRTKLLTGILFSAMLPVTMIVPVIKDVVMDRLGGTSLDSAIFISISMLSQFLISPVAGYASDYFQNRNRFITIFLFIDAALFFLMPITRDVEVLLLLRFLEGGAHIFVIGLLIASFKDTDAKANETHKGKSLAFAGIAVSLGAAMGLPLGVLGKSNPYFPFYFGGSILLVLGIVSFFFLRDEEFLVEKKLHFTMLKSAFSESPYLFVPFALNFVDRFTVGFITSSLNLHLRGDLGLHPGLVGLAMAFVLFPMSVLSYPMVLLSRKVGIIKLALGGSLVYGIFLGLSGWTTNLWILFPFLVLTGIGAGVMFVPSLLLASELSPKNLSATVMSAFTGVGSLGFMLGPIFSVYLQNLLQSMDTPFSFGILSAIFGSMEIFLVLLFLPLGAGIQKFLSSKQS